MKTATEKKTAEQLTIDNYCKRRALKARHFLCLGYD